MGFGDFLKGAGKFLLDAGKEISKAMIDKAEEIKREKENLKNKSDNELIYIIKNYSRSDSRSLAARSLLKDRGYSQEYLSSIR